MKPLLLLFTCFIFCCYSAWSQEDSTVSQAYADPGKKLKVYLNGGINIPYTEVDQAAIRPLVGISAIFTTLPDLDINLELNTGSLSAGVPGQEDVLGFTTKYVDVMVTGRLRPFAVIKNPQRNTGLNILSGIFVGTGIGFLSYTAEPNPMPNSPAWNPLEANRRLDFYFPLEGGLSLPVARFNNGRNFFIQAVGRIHFCFSDQIDGYDPFSDNNKKRDAFNSFRLGIGLDF